MTQNDTVWARFNFNNVLANCRFNVIHGRVGIGTNTPGQALDVNGTIKTNHALDILSSTAGNTHIGGAYGSNFLSSQDGTIIRTYDGTRYTTIADFESSGNIGFGTTSPNQKLHTYKTGGANYLKIAGDTGQQQAVQFNDDDGSA